MFAEPQSIEISGVTRNLARVGSGLDTGVFSTDDRNVKLSVAHTYNKRVRRTVRLDHRKVAADPLNADQNLNYSASIYVVVDAPQLGYSPAEILDLFNGFMGNLEASASLNATKFIGGES